MFTLSNIVNDLKNSKKIKNNTKIIIDINDLVKVDDFSNKSDYVFRIKSINDNTILFCEEIENEEDEHPLIHYYLIKKFYTGAYCMTFLAEGLGENHSYIKDHNFIIKYNNTISTNDYNKANVQ